ncbi:prepilin-type N-terminal cleavage/methylation domain-containing protein [Piscinibacter sakaiensis]|uniref:prepilin-type N-terminal cleavage/methylation domain-containing protein n=1 Tax=Piscinibacter sakaiensis TaxID=1547922 RepID=UPI003AB0E685
MKRSRGFSLVEVLAAMVIFSAGAVVLFSWITQTADRLGQLTLEQRRLFGDLTALEYARGLNPMRRPSGALTISDVDVSWNAVPVGEERPVRSGDAPGQYVVQLYQVDLQSQVERDPVSARTVYLAGWRRTAQAAAANPFSNLFEKPPAAADAQR